MTFLLTLCVLWLLSSTGYSADAQEQERIKIGAILPLTGVHAAYGVAARNGFKLAQKDHLELFKNIQFVFDDSQLDSKTAISAFQRMRGSRDAAMIYLWGYGPSQALAPIAETERFPLLAVSAERSVSANRSYVLRFCNHNDAAAQVLLDHLRSRKAARLAVVKTEFAFVNGIVDAMEKYLRDGETLDVIGTYEVQDSDFRTTISKLRARRFDALGVFLVTGQISQFYKQSKQLKFKAPTFGTTYFNNTKEIADADGAMTDAVFVAPFVNGDFAARYVKEYGSDVHVNWAANGYEFAVLAARLFGNGTTRYTSEQIISNFNSSRARSAGASDYEYVESKDGSGFDFKMVMRRIEKNGIVDITE